MIGLGAAAWQEGIQLFGVISTGDIDPVFTSVEPLGDPEGASAAVINDGKTIDISIKDARPGDNFTFKYTIVNQGSVPVSFYTAWENNIDSGITFNNLLPQVTLDGNGGSVDGELLIQVGNDVKELTPYGFNLTLFFQQWNIAP